MLHRLLSSLRRGPIAAGLGLGRGFFSFRSLRFAFGYELRLRLQPMLRGAAAGTAFLDVNAVGANGNFIVRGWLVLV